jgi:hypothetical protein
MTDYESYACEYEMDGRQWTILVMAKSYTDASRRLRAMGTTGVVLGNNVTVVPATPGVGPMVRIWCFFANMFRSAP